MAQDGFAWIYLVFFLIIPLSRILPRVVRKWKAKNRQNQEKVTTQSYPTENESFTELPKSEFKGDIPSQMKPHSLEILVLGELNRGVKNFNSIQKNLEIDTQKLDETLQKLENQGLMKVQHKQGLLGPKIELLPTEEGFKKFYS
ncbi:MAG: winged helix-turn-helix transcriptional regulator [Nitrosopumilaceae archaeon]|nr:winged helix-turn-helix transcriptional regulator [Nitrosopumilaceae archaeon]